MRDRMRLRPCFRRMLGGHNAPIGTNGEKTIPAGGAPVGGKTKQPEQPVECPCPVLSGNALEIHVPAHVAMRVPNIRDRNSPRIKTLITAAAAPGPQQSDPVQIVLHTLPTGTAGSVAMTGRAKQSFFSPEKTMGSIREGSLTWQVPL
jgi:hypothetical protein